MFRMQICFVCRKLCCQIFRSTGFALQLICINRFLMYSLWLRMFYWHCSFLFSTKLTCYKLTLSYLPTKSLPKCRLKKRTYIVVKLKSKLTQKFISFYSNWCKREWAHISLQLDSHLQLHRSALKVYQSPWPLRMQSTIL